MIKDDDSIPLQYEGPETFKTLVFELYGRVYPFLSRNDKTHVIVGDIGEIYNDGDDVVVKGDPDSCRIIDDKYKQWHDSRDESSYEALALACTDAGMLNKSIVEYNAVLDLIIISPSKILKYIDACNKDAVSMRAESDKDKYFDYLFDLSLPNFFANYLVHWDLGDSQFNIDLQRNFHDIDLAFDRKKDGKFSFETDVKEPQEYRHNSVVDASIGDDSRSRLSDHFTKMVELGIYNFQNVAAKLYSTFVSPPTYRIVKIDAPRTTQLFLLNKINQEGPGLFQFFVKEKIDTAYKQNRNVFDILGLPYC